MNKKVLYGLLIFILIVVIINVGVIIVNFLSKEETVVQPKKKGDAIVNRLVCTYTDKDDFHYTIDLSFQENVLVTKIEEMKWEDKKKETCDFYTKRLETFNSIRGIVDTINCNDTDGTRITTYNIANLDTKEARIAELRYINEDNTFDIAGYKLYRQNDGYKCNEE